MNHRESDMSPAQRRAHRAEATALDGRVIVNSGDSVITIVTTQDGSHELHNGDAAWLEQDERGGFVRVLRRGRQERNGEIVWRHRARV